MPVNFERIISIAWPLMETCVIFGSVMRVAIIGAGPSGFFVAGELFRRVPGCEVHMYEKRFAPYGLVRYGVAPDHQTTRRAIKMFDQIADDPRFQFYGGVEIGKDISLDQLHHTHHAVVICTGAERANRPAIPGGDLSGVADAIDFARWTNGEEDSFSPEWLRGVATAVVVGNGNVALDIARILAKPSSEWVATDISPPAMEALIHHRVRHVIIAGRRGPEDASFTQPELEELVSLPDWKIRSSEPLPFGIKHNRPETGRVIEFLFHRQPTFIYGSDRVSGIRFHDQRTGSEMDIPVELVLFATGHKGVPLGDLPFDEHRGVIPNDKGAVLDRIGYYVCGWIKRGAKGLIGQNRKDAIETVASVLSDQEKLSTRQIDPVNWFEKLKEKNRQVITWSDWKQISYREIQRGSALGRPRLNFTSIELGSVLKC